MTNGAALPLAAGPMAESLKRNRASFNTRFAMALRGGARIDIEAFQSHLATTVDAIVRQVANQFAEKVDITTLTLFDLSLELFSEKLLGPDSSEPAIHDAWHMLLPQIPQLVARNPRRIAASVTNAVHQIAANPDARPAEWISRMAALGPQCDDVLQFLQLGQVIAWVSGCPQFRRDALQLARTLPLEIQVALLDCDQKTPQNRIVQAIDSVAANPWQPLTAVLTDLNRQRIRIVRQAGGFRGFEGPFLRPPVVASIGSQLVASDGHDCWTMYADVYGCQFVRSTATIPERGRLTGSLKLSAKGTVNWDGASTTLSELADWNSAACDGQTLAVTIPSSHHVFLVARG
jgi:hypothetical protein